MLLTDFHLPEKGQISKEIAKKLDLIHIDTGALYRVNTFFRFRKLPNDGAQKYRHKVTFFQDLMTKFILEFIPNNRRFRKLYLNGKNIDKEIREPKSF